MTQESKSPSNKVAKAGTKSLAQMNPKEKVSMAKDKFVKAFKDEDEANRVWEKESGFVLQLFHNNNYLTKMDPVSIVTAIHNVALTGLSLNPELKLAYLVPRKGKLYFQSSYAGKREILMRAGNVQALDVELVYECDDFEVQKGSDSKLHHKPDYFGDRSPENIKGGYWIATLLNGQKPFGVMPIGRINEIKARSESVKSGKGSPWDTDFEEMSKKTVLNWGFKSLPKTDITDSVLKAMEADSQLDNEEFNDWKVKQEEMRTDDFDEDSAPETMFTDAEVVEDKPEKKDLPTPPPEEPKEPVDPIGRIKDMKDNAEDERIEFDKNGEPIVVHVEDTQSGTGTGSLFPEIG